MGSIPGLGRSPGARNVNPLQYFSWEISCTEDTGGIQSMRHNSESESRSVMSNIFGTLWIIQSMEFSRPEILEWVAFSSPGDLPTPVIKPRSLQLNHKGSQSDMI